MWFILAFRTYTPDARGALESDQQSQMSGIPPCTLLSPPLNQVSVSSEITTDFSSPSHSHTATQPRSHAATDHAHSSTPHGTHHCHPTIAICAQTVSCTSHQPPDILGPGLALAHSHGHYHQPPTAAVPAASAILASKPTGPASNSYCNE
jgi:hypothetical protein